MNIQDLKLGLSVCLLEQHKRGEDGLPIISVDSESTVCRAIGYFPGFNQFVRLEKYNHKTGEFGGIVEAPVSDLYDIELTGELLYQLGFRQECFYDYDEEYKKSVSLDVLNKQTLVPTGTEIQEIPIKNNKGEDSVKYIAYCPYTDRHEEVVKYTNRYGITLKNNRAQQYYNWFSQNGYQSSEYKHHPQILQEMYTDENVNRQKMIPDIFLSNQIYFSLILSRNLIHIGFKDSSDKIGCIRNYFPIGKRSLMAIQSFTWDICGTDVFSYHPIINKELLSKLEEY